MSIEREIVDLPGPEGSFVVVTYSHTDSGNPDSSARPAMIFLHDVTGLTDGNLAMAEAIAEQGYVVAAPDLFHRYGRMEIMPHEVPYEDTLKIRVGMTNAGHLADVSVLVTHLRSMPGVAPGPVGVLGFCLGGRVAWLAATGGIGAGPSVLFYPTRLLQPDPAVPGSPAPISRADRITSPMLVLFPELDPQNKPEGIATIRAAIDRAGAPAESFVIAGVDHGFAVPGHPAHDPTTGPVEWRHALDFLATHLPVAQAAHD
jgi:carboxymethylenebutenolidase